MMLLKDEGKAIPVTGWTVREHSRRLRLLDYEKIGTWR
jgi:hypothetical protein